MLEKDVEDRLGRSKIHLLNVLEREKGGDTVFKEKKNQRTLSRTDEKHQSKSLTDFRTAKQRECPKVIREKERLLMKKLLMSLITDFLVVIMEDRKQ